MMTTLQIVLAIVGVSLIAIIVIYNVLQERKFRKDADRMFSHKRDDVMLGEAVRTEASKRRTDTQIQLSDTLAHASEARQAVDDAEASPHSMVSDRAPGATSILSSLEPLPAREPVVEPEPVAPAPRREPPMFVPPVEVPPPMPAAEPAPIAMPAAPAEAPAMQSMPIPDLEAHKFGESGMAPAQASGLDATTEYIARLKFAKPQLGNFGPLLSVLRRIGKPVRAFGAKTDGSWEPLSGHPRNMYAQVEFGMQLADRGGALSRDQLDAFCRALYEFAAEEGGAVSCPDKEEALGLAQGLDLFCMDVDVLIGLNVMSADSRPFTSEAMHSVAQEARLALEADGVFHARDDFGHSLFTLANQEEEPFPRDGRGLTTHGVTLLFDVPRVADGLAVFDRMTRLGFDLAWRLEGRLVDDNGRPVSEDSLNRDRARLSQYFSRMEARGIPAGGERALRLFV
jgi:FtsZ-interacting cell division protein ZipA